MNGREPELLPSTVEYVKAIPSGMSFTLKDVMVKVRYDWWHREPPTLELRWALDRTCYRERCKRSEKSVYNYLRFAIAFGLLSYDGDNNIYTKV